MRRLLNSVANFIGFYVAGMIVVLPFLAFSDGWDRSLFETLVMGPIVIISFGLIPILVLSAPYRIKPPTGDYHALEFDGIMSVISLPFIFMAWFGRQFLNICWSIIFMALPQLKPNLNSAP